MKSTSTLAAYVAWALTLCALLMPPAFAAVGVDLLSGTRDAVFGLVEGGDGTQTFADLRTYDPRMLG